jgi:hypothetical protein
VLLALIPVAVALAALQLALLDPLVVGEFGIVVLLHYESTLNGPRSGQSG